MGSIALRHRQAVIDHEYLVEISRDFTGEGHDCVEIDAEVFELMADPTKRRALLMYQFSIKEWFRHWKGNYPANDETLNEIAERYNIIM